MATYTESTTDSTLDLARWGGRQITRIGSRIWMLGTSAAGATTPSVVAYYSDNDGASWTSETVATFGSGDILGMAISRTSANQPWIALTRAGTSQIRVYYRSAAGVWTLWTTMTSGKLQGTQSLEVWYDGAEYHIAHCYQPTYNFAPQLEYRRIVSRTAGALAAAFGSQVTVDSGDVQGVGSEDSRAFGGMVDLSGNFHLVYGINNSNVYLLRYSMKNHLSGWNPPTTVATLGPDSDPNWKSNYVSVALDENQNTHASYISRTVGSTTPQLWYVNNVSGWSTPAQLTGPNGVDTAFSTCVNSSIAINGGTAPVILGSGVTTGGARLILAEKGTGWSTMQITAGETGFGTALQNAQESKPGLLFQARYSATRTEQGIFAHLQGSVNTLVSSDLVWEDAGETPRSAFSVGQAVGLKGFGSAQTDIEIGQTVGLNVAFVQSNSDGLSFGSGPADPAHAYGRTGTAAPRFFQTVGYTYDPATGDDEHYRGVISGVSFGQSISLALDKIFAVSDSLTFSQSIKRTHAKTVEAYIYFEDSVEGVGDRFRSLTDALGVGDVVHLNKEVQLTVTDALTFANSGLPIRDWSALSDHFNPGWTAVLESDVDKVVFLYPASLPTSSLTMKKPELGDQREDFRRGGSVHRNRSGAPRSFTAPVYSRFVLTWEGLLRKRAEEFRVRIIEAMGAPLVYIDHNGVRHNVIITNETLSRSQQGLDYVNVGVTLEKTSRVDLSPTTAG